MNHAIVEKREENDDTKPLLGNNEEHRTSFLRLIIYGSIIVSPSLLAGIAISFSAIALPQMKLDINDASWFSAMFNLGSPIGSILIGLLVDKFGRRPCIMISIVPSVVGWFLLCLDFQRLTTFTGRILTGLNAGCMYVGQVYAAECIVVNHPHWRNPLNTWQAVALAFGTVLSYTFGCLLPYQGVAAIATGISVLLFLINYLYVPESPKWLYHKGLMKEAKRSERILGIHQPILKHIESEECFLIKKTSALKKLKRKEVYKPLLVMTTLYVMVIFSGGSAVGAYMVDILSIDSETSQSPSTIKRYFSPHQYINDGDTDATQAPANNNVSYQLGLIASILVLVSVCLVSSVIRYTGIKKVYYIASVGLTIGMVALGISLLVRFEDPAAQNFVNVLHVVAVWCVAFFYAFGVVTVPTSILGELFPHDAKGFASIPAILFCLSASAALKLHPYLFLYFGGTLYFGYAFVTLLSAIFFAIFVPETVGKTLDEIGDFFSK